MSQKRTASFEELFQGWNLLDTHQTHPISHQSSAASIKPQDEKTSRRGWGLKLASKVMASKRCKLVKRKRSSPIQQERPSKRSFEVLGGYKLENPSPDSAHGGSSTTVSGPRSQSHFPEPISPVRLPGPIQFQHPEADSAVELPLPEVPVSVPALPSIPAPSISELSNPSQLRRGGNNMKRTHPSDIVPRLVIIQRDPAHIVERTASVHSQAAFICSAEECSASEGVDDVLRNVDNSEVESNECVEGTPASQEWWAASFEQSTVPRSSADASPRLYSVVSDDGSFFDLNDESRPAATLPQPACSADFDDDPDPWFSPEWEGMQWYLPRIRPRAARHEAWWMD